ncbi:MAG: hypothetical protein ABIJ56_05875 [Pseudomonadota bacterium]
MIVRQLRKSILPAAAVMACLLMPAAQGCGGKKAGGEGAAVPGRVVAGISQKADPGKPEDCEISHQGPEYGHCLWSVEIDSSCGPAGPGPGFKPVPVCICNLCLEDTDCGEKPEGICRLFGAADHGGMGNKDCVYPGDECYPGLEECPDGMFCAIFDKGLPGCVAIPPIPQ